MSYFDPAAQLRRLEQQLEAFERLHADELREFQRRLEAYQRLHEDEVRLLQEEIADLRARLAEVEAADDGAAAAPAGAGGPAGAVVRTRPPAEEAEALHLAPPAVEPIVESAVESALEQTVSRRELFGRHRRE